MLRIALPSSMMFAGLAAAEPVQPTAYPIENGLRRSIAVEGEKSARFPLAARMQHYRVPGVSLAVIDGCRIVDARGFGTSAANGPPITRDTLFQAGSISKTITSVTALRLVDEAKLELDTDVRPLVPGWSASGRAANDAGLVSLRRLLNHTAGLTEVGGKGYERGGPLPTLSQILNGERPANTPPIRIDTTPGGKWAYSSGGYYVVQALMTASTGKSFPSLARNLVLSPAKMSASSFAQPLSDPRVPFAAKAVGPDGSPLPGGWRVNPELAAGGLWTTPSDLARFLIVLTHDIRGESQRLLSPASVRQMLAPGPGNWGLGVELGAPGGPRRIGHTGHNVGFVSEYVMYPDTCQGAVVMTNADEGGWLISEVLRAIADAYHWPEPRASVVQATVPLSEEIVRRFVGTYRLRDFPAEQFTISRNSNGGLYWARKGHIGRDLLPEHAGRLFSPDSRMTLDAMDEAGKLELSFGGGKNIAERVE
jgi:CubicO group peptidase (beta-lactamase class C family)